MKDLSKAILFLFILIFSCNSVQAGVFSQMRQFAAKTIKNLWHSPEGDSLFVEKVIGEEVQVETEKNRLDEEVENIIQTGSFRSLVEKIFDVNFDGLNRLSDEKDDCVYRFAKECSGPSSNISVGSIVNVAMPSPVPGSDGSELHPFFHRSDMVIFYITNGVDITPVVLTHDFGTTKDVLNNAQNDAPPYILKDVSYDNFKEGSHFSLNGRSFLSQPIARAMVSCWSIEKDRRFCPVKIATYLVRGILIPYVSDIEMFQGGKTRLATEEEVWTYLNK